MTRMYENEKLWHPLLLKTFPDGSYLHSSDADISRGREEECRDRLAGRAVGKNSLFVGFLRPYHASAVPPIENPLMVGFVRFGLKPTLGLVKTFLLFCFLVSFCNSDH